MRLLFIIEGIIENNKGISVTLSIVALLFIKKKQKNRYIFAYAEKY